MITWKEMLCGYKESEIDPEHLTNLKELWEKIQKVRAAYGKPMSFSNVYRSKTHHLKIYSDKGIWDTSKIPMKSFHLSGNALDVKDSSGDFHKWCKTNEKLLTEIGFWLETRQGGWQHLQIRSFGSYKSGGTIWFNP